MARIRSIHPGIFTDDEYMALSFPARELIKGIWCECDDYGVFEWRPNTLKARILPADNVDVTSLLAELVKHRFCQSFDYDGKRYGAVRNFRKYQRPKKPTSSYPFPPQIRAYVGLDGDGFPPSGDNPPHGSEQSASKPHPVPHQFPTGEEKSPQMEDGGWRMEDGEEVAKSASANVSGATAIIQAFDDERSAAFGESQRRPWPNALDFGTAQRWLSAGADIDLCRSVFRAVQSRKRQAGQEPIDTLAYLDKAVAQAIANRSRPVELPQASLDPEIAEIKRRRAAMGFIE